MFLTFLVPFWFDLRERRVRTYCVPFNFRLQSMSLQVKLAILQKPIKVLDLAEAERRDMETGPRSCARRHYDPTPLASPASLESVATPRGRRWVYELYDVDHS
jgi:hypothetical protein